MSFDQVRKVTEEIIEAWGGLPIAYDNVDFDSQQHKEWVRVVVVDGDRFNAGLGGQCVRHTGLAVIQVFTEQNTGSKGARDHASQVADLYENSEVEGVVYLAAAVTRVGHANDFYQLNVQVPFRYDTLT